MKEVVRSIKSRGLRGKGPDRMVKPRNFAAKMVQRGIPKETLSSAFELFYSTKKMNNHHAEA